MPSGRDLRLVLGKRSVHGKAAHPVPLTPPSPEGILMLDEEAMAAAAAQGPRRSSLNADTSFLERVHADSDEDGRTADAEAEAVDEDVEGDEDAVLEPGQAVVPPLACARGTSTDSQASCSSLEAACGLAVGRAVLPAFLEEKEREGSGRQLQESDGAKMMSESPSPSQRAAIDAMYGGGGGGGGEGAGGRGGSSGLSREAEEMEAEAEAAATVRVMDHMIAEHLIQDRLELKRYDSADAELEMARRKQQQQQRGQQQRPSGCASSPTHALASRLQAEVNLSDEDGSSGSGSGGGSGSGHAAGQLASALHHPPRTHTSRRSEGMIELMPEGPTVPTPRPRAKGAEEDDNDDSEPLGLARPTLGHFDSGDYFKEEEERKVRRAKGLPSPAGVIRPEGPAQDGGGHKATAAFLLHRRR